ncbi:MAG: hypothetical protein R2838_25930 [Caldilineaceae bacterium]
MLLLGVLLSLFAPHIAGGYYPAGADTESHCRQRDGGWDAADQIQRDLRNQCCSKWLMTMQKQDLIMF